MCFRFGENGGGLKELRGFYGAQGAQGDKELGVYIYARKNLRVLGWGGLSSSFRSSPSDSSFTIDMAVAGSHLL